MNKSSKIVISIPKTRQEHMFPISFSIFNVIASSWRNNDPFVHVQKHLLLSLTKKIFLLKVQHFILSRVRVVWCTISELAFPGLTNAKAVEATNEDVTCFPSFLVRIWPWLVQYGAVCVISPSRWKHSSRKLSGVAKIAAREQSLSQLSFADGHVHKKVLHQQQQLETPMIWSCKAISRR